MRYTLRTYLIACVVLGVLLSGVIWVYRVVQYGIDDGYAQWGAVDLVINYMEANEGQWPPSWEALERTPSVAPNGWSFEHFRSRVFIDFDAKADDLRRQALSSDEPTFNVIRAVHDTGVYIGEDPNTMLWRYFRSLGSSAND